MERDYDVIVIGGGPAGLMTCVGSLQQSARVLLVEKGEKLGRKLIISGGGRCNVTNAKDTDEMIKNIPGNGRFMFRAFHQFSNRDIIRFFEHLGVALKEEDRGRMFPVTDKAITVAETLIEYIKSNGVQISLNSPVERVIYTNGSVHGIQLKNGKEIYAPAVVVAVGGKSVPKTGSTGDGYAWAEEAGHTITPLYPTEVPLTSNEPWICDRSLQGLSLREITLTLWNAKGKRISVQEGDMIFTHFGISGPAALRLGHYVSVQHLREGKKPLLATVDLLPNKSTEEIFHECWKLAEQESKKAIKNVLKGYLPERIIPLLLVKAEIAEETTFAHLSRQKMQVFSQLVKQLPIFIIGTLAIEEAFVTGGGVSTKEIDPKTFGSKLVNGLYFAGEIMDVHAHTGGYNITVAFSSGYVAGKSAARYSLGEALDKI